MEINKFTPELLELTRSSWLAAAEAADIPSIDYEMNLDWAAKHVDYTDPGAKSFAYGIFSEPGAAAVGIIDIVYRRMTGPDVGWLKMLTLMLSPDYAPHDSREESIRLVRTLEAYAAAIIGTIQLTGQHPARVAKFYSRSDSQYNLLFALNERLNQGTNYKSKIQGRWLVLTAV
jgi:hypothetical protein